MAKHLTMIGAGGEAAQRPAEGGIMPRRGMTMKEAEARNESKQFGFTSAIGLIKWLFEGRVVRTVNGQPPDIHGNAIAGADPDEMTVPEVDVILGDWDEGDLDEGWNARMANQLAHARTIAITGEASGQTSFDGSQDVAIYTHIDALTNTELEAMLT